MAKLLVCIAECDICHLRHHEKTVKSALRAAKKCEKKGHPVFAFSEGKRWKKGKKKFLKIINTKVSIFYHTPMYQVNHDLGDGADIGRWYGEKQLKKLLHDNFGIK